MSILNKGKKRPESHIIGDVGMNILRKKLPKEWVIRELNKDYGIDLDIEIFDEKGICKSEHLFAQVKSHKSLEQHKYRIKSEKPKSKTIEINTIKQKIDIDLISNIVKMGTAMPFLLFVVDLEKEEVYFVCMNDYIDNILLPKGIKEKKYVTIYIPMLNKLDNNLSNLIKFYATRTKLYNFFLIVLQQYNEMINMQYPNGFSYIEECLKRLKWFDIGELLVIEGYENVEKEFIFYTGKKISEIKQKDCEKFIKNKNRKNNIKNVQNINFDSTATESDIIKTKALISLWRLIVDYSNAYETWIRKYYLPNEASYI